MTAYINPLSVDPAFVNARGRIQRGDLGQRLAVYAVARAKASIDDPLTTFGLPLIQEIIETSGESPISVTSTRVSGDKGFEQWSMIVGLSSGVRLSVDIASGLGEAQVKALDLRVESSGASQAILVDPTDVAVTVTSARGQHELPAEVTPIGQALLDFAGSAKAIATKPDAEWSAATAVIKAARESAITGYPITM